MSPHDTLSHIAYTMISVRHSDHLPYSGEEYSALLSTYPLFTVDEATAVLSSEPFLFVNASPVMLSTLPYVVESCITDMMQYMQHMYTKNILTQDEIGSTLDALGHAGHSILAHYLRCMLVLEPSINTDNVA